MIVSDGAGGAIITWDDRRPGAGKYSQRINASGQPQWAANGIAITNAPNSECLTVVEDGDHGAIYTWSYGTSSDVDVAAQRLNGSGDKQWGTDGIVVISSAGQQILRGAVSDNSGGVICFWEDTAPPNQGLYAQRLNSSGEKQWEIVGKPLWLIRRIPPANSVSSPTVPGELLRPGR